MPYLRQVVYWKSLKLTEYSFMPYLRHFRTISTLVYVYSNRAIKASSVILSHFQAFQPCKSYMKIYIILEDSLLVTRLSGYCTGVRENYLETQTQKTQPIRPHFVCLSGGEMQRGSQSTKTGPKWSCFCAWNDRRTDTNDAGPAGHVFCV